MRLKGCNSLRGGGRRKRPYFRAFQFSLRGPTPPLFCECAVSGSARHGTLTHFYGVGRPSQREAGENWKALVLT